ncbi:MAG: thiolase domain-containing protein [Canidatus Methanoxibalbensis ujae]|nr:thiolase domain-containing protein [Candidatus Methanoxibalbensis ujae]MCW7077869.1 thiolase domain-containing protein [Candidatus Methanoxibalbensis ujae]
MKRKVAVIGVGCTKFGEIWEKSLRDLAVEAGMKAIEDAAISGEEIKALYGGNMSAGMFIEQEHVGVLIADYSGLASLHIPAVRVEAACASGSVAFHLACLAVSSGMYDIVIAAGVEKVTDVDASRVEDMLASSVDREWEAIYGATLPALYAQIAMEHMKKYGTTEEQLARVAVKNHANAVHNEIAQYRREISEESVLRSPIVASPLHVLDCSTPADGAAAVVICDASMARKYTDTPVYVAASAQATDTIALHDRHDITTMLSTATAARKAFRTAGIEPSDVDVAEVHDIYTISEIVSIEDIGFFKKGEGGTATEEGATEIGGEIAVNPSGGLKACGNPPGATGIRQIVELVTQLRGEAGKRQVPDAEIGLAHNMGGTGGTAVVHILAV